MNAYLKGNETETKRESIKKDEDVWQPKEKEEALLESILIAKSVFF